MLLTPAQDDPPLAIEDLFVDLSDGIILCRLLAVLCPEEEEAGEVPKAVRLELGHNCSYCSGFSQSSAPRNRKPARFPRLYIWSSDIASPGGSTPLKCWVC